MEKEVFRTEDPFFINRLKMLGADLRIIDSSANDFVSVLRFLNGRVHGIVALFAIGVDPRKGNSDRL